MATSSNTAVAQDEVVAVDREEEATTRTAHLVTTEGSKVSVMSVAGRAIGQVSAEVLRL